MKLLLPLFYGAVAMIIAFVTHHPTGIDLFTVGLIGMVFGRLEANE